MFCFSTTRITRSPEDSESFSPKHPTSSLLYDVLLAKIRKSCRHHSKHHTGCETGKLDTFRYFSVVGQHLGETLPEIKLSKLSNKRTLIPLWRCIVSICEHFTLFALWFTKVSNGKACGNSFRCVPPTAHNANINRSTGWV